jgi:hypothetical protein
VGIWEGLFGEFVVKPDQRVKYLVPLAMVVVPLVGFIALTVIAMFGFVGMEESEGLAGL